MTASSPLPRAAARQAGLAGLLLAALSLAACEEKAQAQAPGSGPPPSVKVVSLPPEPVTLQTIRPGRTAAFQVAEVRPRVSGVIRARLFREGQEVAAGQPLYQIDPAPYEASLASAQANLAKAEATLGSARVTVSRYRPLVAQNAVSRLDYETAVATQRGAEADVAAARAAVTTAQINLDYTKVDSPIAGATSRSAMTVGALVTADQTATMLTVTQLDPIYVDVTQPATTLLRLRRDLAEGRLARASESEAEVRLVLEDGTDYPHAGRLQVSEVTVDQSTGSVTLRAQFPNPDRMLMPGMFVREKVAQGVAQAGLLVPQQAVQRNAKGEAVVKVVQADGSVEQRVIDAGEAIGTSWLARQGLQAGDKVIVEGGQRVQPGARPQVTEMSLQELRRGTQPQQQAQAQAQAQAPTQGGQR
jgi:membrane fusion protein (multidrug efflux system)